MTRLRILVTGASSLLVRRCAEALIRRGDDVVCLQRHRAEIDAAQILGDIRDADLVCDAAKGCDVIVHAAAKVGVVGRWADYHSINVEGTSSVLAAARTRAVGRLVHVSTPSVAHTGRSIVGEGAGPAALGRAGAFYAESKAIGERLALAACSDSLAVVAIRPHLVWGPGDTQLVGRIVDRARDGRLALVGSGAALIDTTYVDCAAGALVAAVDANVPGAPCAGRAYVIANGEPRPVRELILGICAAAGLQVLPLRIPRRIARTTGSAVEGGWRLAARLGRTTSEPPLTRFLAEQLGTAHWFDPRPARVDLGWVPTVSIDEGLRRLGEWFDGCRN